MVEAPTVMPDTDVLRHASDMRCTSVHTISEWTKDRFPPQRASYVTSSIDKTRARDTKQHGAHKILRQGCPSPQRYGTEFYAITV
jgi:hypothetical protein